MCRGLSHAFEVVRLYRTFSNHIFTRGSRCVWYLYTCSRWFNRSEPPRTFTNHFNTERARCVEVYHMRSIFHMRSKQLDYSKLSQTTISQWEQGVHWGWLNRSEHLRTFSNNFSAEKAMYGQVFYMSLGWLSNLLEPS